MIQLDNIQIDLTAIYVFIGVLAGVIISPIDAYLINKEYKLEKVYHGVKFTAMYLLGGLFFYFCLPPDNYWVLRLIACGLAYSISFDAVLNALRGKELFYIGQTAFFDKMARKYLKTGINYAFVRAFGVFLIGIGIVIHNLIVK